MLIEVVALLTLAVAQVASQARWLRVAQREHYLPNSIDRFAARWWSSTVPNLLAIAVAVALSIYSFEQTWSAFAVAVIGLATPFGLRMRGTTSKLAWTRRLRLLAAFSLSLYVLPIIACAVFTSRHTTVLVGALLLVGSPMLVEIALVVTSPLERRLANRFVEAARERLGRIAPTVIAITGSYGKTTTKGYVAHLLGAQHIVLASPRSFNNRAGLARTVNEHLVAGTEILIAEMGTYGPGEIREMCTWITPNVAVLTAIGPVHLERFRNLEVTLRSKAEIAEHAECVVLNVDDELLRTLVGPLREQGKRVVTCSALDTEQQICLIDEGTQVAMYWDGRLIGREEIPTSHRPTAYTNVACAIGVVAALGGELIELLPLLSNLPQPPNRLSLTTGESGVVILDDTFNSNPAGAALGLSKLASIGDSGGRRVLVTPGMVELGPVQVTENRRLAELASQCCTDIVVVNRTNRSALRSGIAKGTNSVFVDSRAAAVAWVREHLGPHDVVLYENDLPDHYA